MAGIRPELILGIKTPELVQHDPMERYGKSLALQGLMGQQDIQALQMQQTRQGIDDERATREAFAAAGGDKKKTIDALLGRGLYKPAQALQKSILEEEGKRATIGKDEAAAGKSRHEVQIGQLQHGASILGTAKDQPSYEAALRVMALSFGPESVAQMPPQFDPQFVQASIAKGMTAAQRLKAEHDRATLAGTTANQPFKADGTPNLPVQEFKKDVAKKGAANVSVKTDVKTGESLAAQVGPMMKDSTTIAEGAVRQVDAAQRIARAVDSGKIIAGPGADARIVGKQIAAVLNIGGKDDAEIIANTRQAIRGLAELTLQGRQQMRGQGAITESEGKLAERAMSGEISLTAAEIKQLARASERAARFNHAEHTRKLKVMQDNPDLQRVAPFYQGPGMPAEVVETPGAAPVSDVRSQADAILRGGRGGR